MVLVRFSTSSLVCGCSPSWHPSSSHDHATRLFTVTFYIYNHQLWQDTRCQVCLGCLSTVVGVSSSRVRWCQGSPESLSGAEVFMPSSCTVGLWRVLNCSMALPRFWIDRDHRAPRAQYALGNASVSHRALGIGREIRARGCARGASLFFPFGQHAVGHRGEHITFQLPPACHSFVLVSVERMTVHMPRT